MTRKQEIERAEAYALRQMRALLARALEADVEGSWGHDGSDEFIIEHDAPGVPFVPLRIRLEVVYRPLPREEPVYGDD